MRYGTFLFILFCQFIVVSGAWAQEDAGTDSGPLESIDTTADCMQACAREYELCVTSATIPLCIANIPECRGLAPRATEIMAAFCDACGRAAVGCGGDDPPEGAVAGTRTEPSPDPPDGEAPRRRRLTAEEREQAELERARGICARQRGIWDAETVVLMPDGTGRHGICRTPEGAELARMIDDEHDARAEEDERLRRMITDEERARIAADQRHDDDIAIIQSDVEAQNSRIAMMIAHFICAESGAERWPLSQVDGTTRRYLERDSGLVRDGYVECIHVRERAGTERADGADDPHGSESASSSRRIGEHPGLGNFGLQLQPFFWVGFAPLHPSLVQTRGGLGSTPVGIGFDATLTASLTHGWYATGGAGIAYDWPDFQPFALNLRVVYHAGLMYYVAPFLSIGFGYLGSDRFRPNLQSVHSFHGGYVDLGFHFRFNGDVVGPAWIITLRGAIGALFRPTTPIQVDGQLYIMTGVEF